jgi:hypothetical protein
VAEPSNVRHVPHLERSEPVGPDQGQPAHLQQNQNPGHAQRTPDFHPTDGTPNVNHDTTGDGDGPPDSNGKPKPPRRSRRQRIHDYRRSGKPIPPTTGEDWISGILLEERVIEALINGAPVDLFDWTTAPTPEGMEAILDRWRKPKPRNTTKITGRADKDRKRHIAHQILGTVETQLSDADDGTRDESTRDAIWDLSKFVNDPSECLSEREVSDAIVRAAHKNGLDTDHGNGGITKIERDVPRGVDKSRQLGVTVDWDRFDWLARDYDDAGQTAAAENHDAPTQSDDDDTPVLADLLLTRSDLHTLPDPEPLIDNTLDQGTVALLYGKWGTAKTFTALAWAASVATGTRWQGRDTRQRRVLYVVGEASFGFKGRVAAWETGWQTTISDQWWNMLPEPVNLNNDIAVGNLSALIAWGGYSFVILDTLARCMVGADENSAKDCGKVVDSMTRLLRATPNGRGVILGVHHAGKDGKTLRGSSAFESAADTVYFSSTDEDQISLTREKRKDGPEYDNHLLRLNPIPGTNSAVIDAGRPESSKSHLTETTARTATLRLIMSQHFSLTGATSTQLRQIAVEDGTFTRPTFYRALSDLLESGWLVNTGTEKRPFYVVNSSEG